MQPRNNLCRKVPRKDWYPSDCRADYVKHFRDYNLTMIDELTFRNGQKIQLPRKCPKLKETAYSCTFENCPQYLSENSLFTDPVGMKNFKS